MIRRNTTNNSWMSYLGFLNGIQTEERIQVGLEKIRMETLPILDRMIENDYTVPNEKLLEIYSIIFVLSNENERNKQMIYEHIRNYIVYVIENIKYQIMDIEDDNLFVERQINTFSKISNSILEFLNHIFGYIHRTYILPNSTNKIERIDDAMMLKYKEICFEDSIGNRLKSIFEKMIYEYDETENEEIPIKLVNISNIYRNMVIYNQYNGYDEDFIPYLKQMIRTFYITKRNENRIKMNNIEYCHWSQIFEQKYKILIQKILRKSTLDSDFHHIFIEEMYQNISHHILNDIEHQGEMNFHFLLERNDILTMKMFYDIFSNLSNQNSLTEMGQIFGQYVYHYWKNRMESIFENTEDKDISPILVNEMIQIDRHFYQMKSETGFENDLLLTNTYFINVKNVFMNEYSESTPGIFYNKIVEYIDCLMKNIKDENAREFENKIRSILNLESYISDKDIFNELLRIALGKRLLYNTIVDIQFEKDFIEKIKNKNGLQSVSKMAGMIIDYELNHSNPHHHHEITDLHLTPHIYNQSNWSNLLDCPIHIPNDLDESKNRFERLYKVENPKMKLKWYWIYSTVDFKLNTPDQRKYNISMNTLQYTVFHLFTTHSILSYSDIQSRTNIPDDFLKRILHSLSCHPKNKLLKRMDSTQSTISNTDVFEYKPEIQSKTRNITIPCPSFENMTKVKKIVEEDRTHAIEASIVRIMKSRKIMNHNDLFAEISQQTTLFSMKQNIFKKVVENLIEREYLERDSNDIQLYKYLA